MSSTTTASFFSTLQHNAFSWFSPSTSLVLILLLIFALLNLKNLPLVWTFRLFTILLQSRSWLRPTPQHLTSIFQPLIFHTRSPLLEIDYYLHKNNATFFTDVDIARWHLIFALLWPVIRSPPPNVPDGKPRGGTLAVILGGIACTFKREIKPYERYEVFTRVLCWDEKWVYFVSHFIRAGKVKRLGWSLQPWRKGVAMDGSEKTPPEKAILATSVSKCIFRNGRDTVKPETVFRAAGLLPGDGGMTGEKAWDAAKVEDERLKGMKIAEAMTGLNLAHEAFEPEMGPVLAEYGDIWAWA